MVGEKVKSEGGSGGKRGHSNMDHWAKTEEIKESARRKRKQADVDEVQRGLEESAEDDEG